MKKPRELWIERNIGGHDITHFEIPDTMGNDAVKKADAVISKAEALKERE